MSNQERSFKNYIQGDLELAIDTLSGEVFASQSAVARMCQCDESTIRRFITSQSVVTIVAMLQTKTGFKPCQLLDKSSIKLCLLKFNDTASTEALLYFDLPNLNIVKPIKVKKQFVYLIGDLTRGVCKIGISVKPKLRLRSLQVAYPYPLAVLATVVGTSQLELGLHDQFKELRLEGEWFKIHSDIFKAFNLQISDLLRSHIDLIRLGTFGERLMLIQKIEEYANINACDLEELDTLIARVAQSADRYQIKFQSKL